METDRSKPHIRIPSAEGSLGVPADLVEQYWCNAQDPFTSGRCHLPNGHDGPHYAVVGAGARKWESSR
jgi:hypothetical protein